MRRTSGEKPNNTSTNEDDSALWYGDVVEILLETESHSYYQIAISPSGVLTDLDRGAGKSLGFGWDSQAEVVTNIADGRWTIEIRIPVTEDENDPAPDHRAKADPQPALAFECLPAAHPRKRHGTLRLLPHWSRELS
ncbi:MAG: hypothetical protein R3F31_21005 [Verrucomicrobiales bacterium]